MNPNQGKGWILVIDDAEAMRCATSRTLRVAGWKIVEAATGLGALELVGRMPRRASTRS